MCLKGGVKRMEPGFLVVPSNSTRGNRHKEKQQVPSEYEESFFTVRMAHSPSLDLFETFLCAILYNQL